MVLHRSVLLQESIAALAIKPDGIYIDGTFGRGGHTHALLQQLQPNARVIAVDKDLQAITYGKERFAADTRLTWVHDSFANVLQIAQQQGVDGHVDGILLDLGVSSPQLDDAERGFSFMQPGPLDMRMDQTQPQDAAQWINHTAQAEMAEAFRTYGEERFAGRIARAIVEARAISPITTTQVLAEIVKKANPKWEKHKHPATRVFQAIRIVVNQELADLERGLQDCIKVLAIGGRLAVISFHSLEDRIVKQFMRREEQGVQLPRHIPVKAEEIKTHFKRIGKAVKPHDEEVKENIRSRSAVLRIGEKIA